jgi:nucleoside-diphosphate-sugar epimerase
VLGDGDPYGLDMFRLIDQWGWHFVPSFSMHNFSLIHVEDLANVLIGVADRGRRLSNTSESEGIYFASADETVSYSRLGRMIGDSLGRRRTRVLKVALPVLWMVAGANEIKARLSSTPQFLNFDKFREASGGSWTCSNEKLKNEVGFAPAMPLMDRLNQTSAWYRNQGWLARKNVPALANQPRHVSGA